MATEDEIFYTIQPADPALHCDGVRELIQELASYQSMPDGPKITAMQLRKDIEDRRVNVLVATLNREEQCYAQDTVIAYLLYYYAYSSWEGMYMFVEDIYVKPAFRRKGVGNTIWKVAAKMAYEKGLPRLEWNVLSWNKTAMEFYNKIGGINLTDRQGWRHYRLDAEGLVRYLQGS